MTKTKHSTYTSPRDSTTFEYPHKPPSEKQIALFKDLGNPSIVEMLEDGGARSGKTWGICLGIVARALKYPGSRHLVARYRRAHLEKTLWIQTLLPIMKISFPEGGYTIDSQKLIISFPNGSQIWGEGLDTKDRVEKVMGGEYVTVFLNEATQLIYPTYQALKSRLAQVIYSEDGKLCPVKIIADCNPRNKFHWIYRYFHLHLDPDKRQSTPIPKNIVAWMHKRKWTPRDNPYLSEIFRTILNALTGAERRRLNDGDWVDQEGLVYPGFEAALCDPFPIDKNWEIAGSVDFGFTNPFVHGWWAYDQPNETWYLFDERYERQKTVKIHCDRIKMHKFQPKWIVADHDAEDRETMAENGLPTIAAEKDVSRGIQTTMDLLYKTIETPEGRSFVSPDGLKVKIFRTCVHTIEELSTYSWPESREGHNDKEAPEKENDHCMDMLRYFAMRVSGSSSGFYDYLRRRI